MINVFDPKYFRWYTAALAALLTIAVFTSTSKKESIPLLHEMSLEDGNLPQIIKPVDLDKEFSFAGERLPMNNFDVRERLERELLVNSYWHSSTILYIKSMHRFFPVMEQILAENGIPDDFKYLAVAESSLRNESSPAGAKGFWQFMKSTGQYFGLEINSEVDERFHLEKATEAACEYLLDYKRKFDNWTLCAAAYNMGGPNLRRSLNRQKETNYYDLNLNAETNRYVFRIVAIKEILSDPRNFGFFVDEEVDGYPPLDNYDLVEVDGPIENLGDFAKKNGTTYRMLKIFNPWLLSHKLTNSKRKVYQIKIPKS